MGCLREAGFPFEVAVHAYSAQDAYIYGFALQERDLGFTTPDSAAQAAQRRAETIGALDEYPYLVEVVTKLPESGYDTAVEFAWGLDLILDGLELASPGADRARVGTQQPGARTAVRNGGDRLLTCRRGLALTPRSYRGAGWSGASGRGGATRTSCPAPDAS